MNKYRITKYNPKNRDSYGRYLADDWTSYSDIGRTFAGVLLTESQYLMVENAYLDAVACFLEESGILEMAVTFHSSEISKPKNYHLNELIQASEIRLVVKSLLREEYWCRLQAKDGSYIHVGYDYYLYLGSPKESSVWKKLATDKMLFVEECKSPYQD
ncbi:MAG: hypothetical protein MJE63_13645 [Proteobacteria bacterium]|nr:hypothetical protein [Pseudomonadota bacterium]